MAKEGAKVLLVGSGGREHAIAWKLSRSPHVAHLAVAPGNDAFSPEWERWPVTLSDGRAAFEQLAERAKSEEVDLAVIGPDNPLAEGIVDVFRRHGTLTFGPTAAAARIEASKGFAKDVMQAAGVPTARFVTVSTYDEARRFLSAAPWPPVAGHGWVVKADGLALGKGVQVCSTLEEALTAARQLLIVSGKLVIEERLSGEEISWMAFCAGEKCALMEPARDYKRMMDGDRGPNTGGMGAFSPVDVPESWAERVRDTVFLPTLKELKKRGAPFEGVLFAGLMVNPSKNKLWVLEFNARFGDPETQVLLPRMEDDLFTWCQAVAKGDMSGLSDRVKFTKKHAVYVVGAAKGYPDNPEKGETIAGLSFPNPATDPEKVGYFGAGVIKKGSDFLTSGGRVFGALGLGENILEARELAYQRIRSVSFSGMQFRSDVAEL